MVLKAMTDHKSKQRQTIRMEIIFILNEVQSFESY